MDPARLVEKWFDNHDEDGDFLVCDRAQSFSIIGPTADSTWIIYSTKGHVTLPPVARYATALDFGIICRCGLPSETDIHWLRGIIQTRELMFVGDMDPADTMIFAWLRARLQSIVVTHVGINDRFLSKLGISVPVSYRIRLGPAGTAAVSALDNVLPDANDTLGRDCRRTLKEGYKIELEAVVSTIGNADPILAAAIG
ncbi:MAG TPA: hypothetical protein VHE81_00920 [Lacipirellulaceae bacterium]|nr:hypothetical protein [Lacipirellulaceae bacterium]